MDYTGILIAAVVVAILGIAVGLFLGFASKKFAVEVDEKELAVRDALPGNNCGGCGYAGCDALAKAIAAGEAPVNACPVGGPAAAEKIAAVMGVESGSSERKAAFVKCSGVCNKVRFQYEYYGDGDCREVSVVPGAGEKQCAYGCMGYGSCVKACKFDAIHVVDGVAVVDSEKCTACGACVNTCPMHLIELIPVSKTYRVTCSSNAKGKQVREACDNGCIGCMLCVKQCEFDAIHVENNLARIDYSKCTGCGKCAAKCPAKIIHKI